MYVFSKIFWSHSWIIRWSFTFSNQGWKVEGADCIFQLFWPERADDLWNIQECGKNSDSKSSWLQLKNVIEIVALKKHQCDTLAEKVSFLVIGYYYQKKSRSHQVTYR